MGDGDTIPCTCQIEPVSHGKKKQILYKEFCFMQIAEAQGNSYKKQVGDLGEVRPQTAKSGEDPTLQRLMLLEAELAEMRASQGQGTVQNALAQVRVLALRASTSNTVLIAAMETLADAAQRVNDKQAEHFKMSLKACRENEKEGRLHSLITKLIGSEEAKKVNSSLDAWKKGITKAEKTEKEKKGDGQPPELMAQIMGMMMGQFHPGMGMRGRGRGRGRGAYSRQPTYQYPQGQRLCYSCQSPDHISRNCPRNEGKPSHE